MITADWLTSRAYASPQNTALYIDEARWSYAELERLVNGVCARLLDLGVEQGHFVGALLPNSLAYVCLIHALARLGAVLVPFNTRLAAPELAWQIAQAECRFVLASPEMAEKLSMVNCHLSIVNDGWLVETAAGSMHASPFTLHNLQAVVFTSGTGGKPKGAMLTFANHFYSAMGSAYKLGALPDDVWLSCLPLYHVGGLAVVWRSCLAGTAVDLHPHFDLEAVNDSLDHKPITLISLVPTMLHRLLQSRAHWPASLRLILLGGAAAAPELVQQANALPRKPVRHAALTGHGPPLVAPTYGLTEAASQVTTLLPAEAQHKPGSVGKPLLFTEVQIVAEDGRALPPHSRGEIVVSGPTVMAGYLTNGRQQAAGAATVFATGDIGYLDDDGDLWVVQRRSDLIVSGGENVYPAEVEAVLKSHTAVAEVCVVGLPDVEWGQKVAAMVVVKEGTAVNAEELIHFCRQQLAGYKQPRLIRFSGRLPLNTTGKIARTAVAQMLLAHDASRTSVPNPAY